MRTSSTFLYVGKMSQSLVLNNLEEMNSENTVWIKNTQHLRVGVMMLGF